MSMAADPITGHCDVCHETVTLDPDYASGWRHDSPGALHGAAVTGGDTMNRGNTRRGAAM